MYSESPRRGIGFIDYTMRKRKPKKTYWWTKNIAPTFVDADIMLEMDQEWRTQHKTDQVLLKVWVVYQWDGTQWSLSGFRRRRRFRHDRQTMNKFFAKVRRRWLIDKSTEIMVMDLATAQAMSQQPDQSWQRLPPQRRAPKRARWLPIEQALPAIPTPKQARRRAPKRAIRYHKQKHSYIALGRRRFGDRELGYLYLGPLTGSDSLGAARREADRLFGAIWDTIVVATTELSKRLRGRIHSGKKIVAGRTRLLWPEPIELDEVLTLPRLDTLRPENVQYLLDEATKQVKRAEKRGTDKDVVHALAALLFIEAFA